MIAAIAEKKNTSANICGNDRSDRLQFYLSDRSDQWRSLRSYGNHSPVIVEITAILTMVLIYQNALRRTLIPRWRQTAW